MAYVNGKYGFIVWKNGSDSSTGNVHPDHESCRTRNTIRRALPAFQKVVTQENATIENTNEQARAVSIKANESWVYTHNNTISHIDTINPWAREITKKNNRLPKNFSESLYFINWVSVIFVVNNAINRSDPTHIASTVKNGAIADQ